MTRSFVHLNVHSTYSILNGVAKPDEICRKAAELGMSAIALTDHENMFGMVKFQKAAQAAGIRPVFGAELNVCARRMSDKEGAADRHSFRIGLLVKDKKGFENLTALISRSYLEGYYFHPRVDWEALRKHHEGLIALSSGLDGEVAHRTLTGQFEMAREAALRGIETFGAGNYFLEIQNHGLREQTRLLETLPKLSAETGIPLAATNEVYFIRREDSLARLALNCIRDNRAVREARSNPYLNDQHFLKSPSEMTELFPGLDEALDATAEISERCDFRLDLNPSSPYLPDFDLPEGKTADGYLEELTLRGLKDKYPAVTRGMEDRTRMELDCIRAMGFSAYFLIVWDLIRHANENGIPTGPGRGSVAGSIVAYALNITKVDPIKYDLQFERFLNPERVSMPDIDMDFCEDRREEVIKYARQKYGADRVAMIITFGHLKAKAAIRDTGRALEIPLPVVDRIAKMIPFSIPGVKEVSIAECIEHVEEMKEARSNDPTVRELLDLAMKIEGNIRNTSTHAAGVVISKAPLIAHLPLYQLPEDETAIAALAMEDVETLGLLKMDFLGLRNLTVIDRALTTIKERTGLEIDIDKIPIDDPATYKLLGEGSSDGVFQFEGNFAKTLLRRQKPTCLEDLIALNALNRPGPIGAGMVEDYLDRRKSPKSVEEMYPHPDLEPVLRDTFGTIIYQEQVMRIGQVIAGFSLAQADLMRRAMGKKKAEEMARMKSQFVEGAKDKGFPMEFADSLFEQLLKFSGYGFNKSHCAAYSVLAYQTAWLKANHPLEFMSALLTSVKESSDKVAQYAASCKRAGIALLSPDVNEGHPHFAPEGGAIRFGLAAVKNVGEQAARCIVAEREANGPYQTIFELCRRVDLNSVNKKTLESLIRCGACDSLKGNRCQKHTMLEEALALGRKAQRDRDSGQIGLFDLADDPAASSQAHLELPLPEVLEFQNERMLSDEKELLGIYLSMHPLDPYKEWIQEQATHTSSQLSQVVPGRPGRYPQATVAGLIANTRYWMTKKGEPMMFVDLEDYDGMVNVVVPPETYSDLKDQISMNSVVAVRGEVQHRSSKNGDDGNPVKITIAAQQIVRHGDPAARQPAGRRKVKLHIHLKPDSPEKGSRLLEEAQRALAAFEGDSPVTLHCDEGEGQVRKFRLPGKGIAVNAESLRYLYGVFGGEDYIWAEAVPAARNH